MAKKVFFETENIRITSERALFYGDYTFDIRKIDAVFVTRQSTSFINYFLGGWFFVGLYALCGDNFIGLLFGLVGFYLISYSVFSMIKPKYALRIKTGLGEVRPLVIRNKSKLQEIKKAIDDAIRYLDYEEEIEKLEKEH